MADALSGTGSGAQEVVRRSMSIVRRMASSYFSNDNVTEATKKPGVTPVKQPAHDHVIDRGKRRLLTYGSEM